jgi:phosphoribosyl 1,2-cyclic phosphate phosphodiesterase
MFYKFRILGCGSSGGVPRVGFGWGSCDSKNKKNRRLRCSLLIEKFSKSNKTTILIDTGPDVRQQLLQANVTNLDAVLYTHKHADHIHGIDDLRTLAYRKREKVQVWADKTTQERLLQGFSYIFKTPDRSEYPPICELNLISDEDIKIKGAGGEINIRPLSVNHGEIDSLGFKVGQLAYIPDVLNIPSKTWKELENLDILIIDALRRDPHPSHTHLEKTLHWLERLEPKRAILTNLHNDLDYSELKKELPKNVEPAFDGLEVKLK